MVIRQLDAGDEASILPIVTLLRKVSGKVERDLCQSTGDRLEHPDEVISAIAGRALATAGTAAATEMLSRYPVAWKHCLDRAGYLSSTFEKLLVNWVETPAHAHWSDAAILLTKRFEARSLPHLIRLLEKFPEEKADFLSSLIVGRLHSMSDEISFTRFPRQLLCQAVVFVKDKDALRKQLLREDKERAAYSSEPGIVLTALALGEGIADGKGNQAKKLVNELQKAQAWIELMSRHGLLISSILPALILTDMFGLALNYTILAISVWLTLISVGLWTAEPPWTNTRSRYFVRSRRLPTILQNLVIFLAGVSIALSVTQSDLAFSMPVRPQTSYLILFMMIVAMACFLRTATERLYEMEIDIRLWGVDVTWSADVYNFVERPLLATRNFLPALYPYEFVSQRASSEVQLVTLGWFFLLIAEWVLLTFAASYFIPSLIWLGALVVGIWAAWWLPRSYQSWRRVAAAASRASLGDEPL